LAVDFDIAVAAHYRNIAVFRRDETATLRRHVNVEIGVDSVTTAPPVFASSVVVLSTTLSCA